MAATVAEPDAEFEADWLLGIVAVTVGDSPTDDVSELDALTLATDDTLPDRLEDVLAVAVAVVTEEPDTDGEYDEEVASDAVGDHDAELEAVELAVRLTDIAIERLTDATTDGENELVRLPDGPTLVE